jgi:hypothetical protein
VFEVDHRTRRVASKKLRNERFDDGWEEAPDDRPNRVDTTLTAETAKVILSRNESPDIGFDRSIGLSPGLDFETKLYFKPNAAELLRSELSKRGYVPDRAQLGANTGFTSPSTMPG